jgi:hypothetical protein
LATIKLGTSRSAANSLAYVLNAEKHPGELLVTGLGCGTRSAVSHFAATRRHFVKDGGIQVHTVIQSFRPGEVTADECHGMGVALAEALRGGHEVIVVTHTNLPHFHNHIVINSVHPETGRKRVTHKLSGFDRIARINDSIISKRGFRVTERGEGNGVQRSVKEKAMKERGVPSYKDAFRSAIEAELLAALSWEEFKSNLADRHGIECEDIPSHKYLVFYDGEHRAVRDRTLNKSWSRDFFKGRIEENVRLREQAAEREAGHVADETDADDPKVQMPPQQEADQELSGSGLTAAAPAVSASVADGQISVPAAPSGGSRMWASPAPDRKGDPMERHPAEGSAGESFIPAARADGPAPRMRTEYISPIQAALDRTMERMEAAIRRSGKLADVEGMALRVFRSERGGGPVGDYTRKELFGKVWALVERIEKEDGRDAADAPQEVRDQVDAQASPPGAIGAAQDQRASAAELDSVASESRPPVPSSPASDQKQEEEHANPAEQDKVNAVPDEGGPKVAPPDPKPPNEPKKAGDSHGPPAAKTDVSALLDRSEYATSKQSAQKRALDRIEASIRRCGRLADVEGMAKRVLLEERGGVPVRDDRLQEFLAKVRTLVSRMKMEGGRGTADAPTEERNQVDAQAPPPGVIGAAQDRMASAEKADTRASQSGSQVPPDPKQKKEPSKPAVQDAVNAELGAGGLKVRPPDPKPPPEPKKVSDSHGPPAAKTDARKPVPGNEALGRTHGRTDLKVESTGALPTGTNTLRPPKPMPAAAPSATGRGPEGKPRDQKGTESGYAAAGASEGKTAVAQKSPAVKPQNVDPPPPRPMEPTRAVSTTLQSPLPSVASGRRPEDPLRTKTDTTTPEARPKSLVTKANETEGGGRTAPPPPWAAVHERTEKKGGLTKVDAPPLRAAASQSVSAPQESARPGSASIERDGKEILAASPGKGPDASAAPAELDVQRLEVPPLPALPESVQGTGEITLESSATPNVEMPPSAPEATDFTPREPIVGPAAAPAVAAAQPQEPELAVHDTQKAVADFTPITILEEDTCKRRFLTEFKRATASTPGVVETKTSRLYRALESVVAFLPKVFAAGHKKLWEMAEWFSITAEVDHGHDVKSDMAKVVASTFGEAAGRMAEFIIHAGKNRERMPGKAGQKEPQPMEMPVQTTGNQEKQEPLTR